MKLTDLSVRLVDAPAKGAALCWDDDEPGFGVSVRQGCRTYIVQYRTKDGRSRRMKLGRTTDLTATKARDKARLVKAEVREGGDPMEAKRDQRSSRRVQRTSMRELAERYCESHFPKKRPSSQELDVLALRKYILPAFASRKVAEINYEDIDRLHRKIGKTYPVRANRVIALLSKMFSLAIKWHMRLDNPCKGIERNHEAKRKRTPTPEELVALMQALGDYPEPDVADAIRLLLLTGARRGEVLGARWAQFDLRKGVWTKPASTTKQKTDHVVPLSGPARAILAELKKRSTGEFVFPGDGPNGHRPSLKKQWRTICKAAGIEGLRVHDLRHAHASFAAGAGLSLPVIGALLGHSNPSTTQRYAHLLDEPLREAAETVGRAIMQATNKARA